MTRELQLFWSQARKRILEVADDVIVFVGGRSDDHTELARNMNATQLRREAWVPA